VFGINLSEIVLIVVIALLLFGPEQLPSIARKAGKVFASLRNLRANLSSQFYEQIGLQQINQIKDDLQQTMAQLKQSISPTSSNQPRLTNFTEAEFSSQEFLFLYQPELDFDYQPELFDEIDQTQ
jgi:Tat protein translocase TatB subunit